MNENEFVENTERLKYKLYRIAYLYLGSESMALDAVDESVYRGYKALRKLRHPEYFDTWLTRILINECKMELRRRKHEQPIDTLPETAEETYDSLPLKEAVRRLPKDLKEIIILRYFSGYTLAQTAECLKIPQGTAATRQRRALSLLKLELSEDEIVKDKSITPLEHLAPQSADRSHL